MSLPIDYHPAHACMLEKGWVLAFAHVRGGGERGKAWHAAGRGLNKWHSFLDFEVRPARAELVLEHSGGRAIVMYFSPDAVRICTRVRGCSTCR